MFNKKKKILFEVIVSDGVCGIPDQHALQSALSQYRLNGLSCSFIQLRQASLRGPVLGHVGFPELFNFIATATFGSFLDENDLERAKGPDGFNAVQRALLTWSFRKGLVTPFNTVISTTTPGKFGSEFASFEEQISMQQLQMRAK